MMHEVMQILTVQDPAAPAVLKLLERHLRASHTIFDPCVERIGSRVGISVKAGGVTPFEANTSALAATVLAMRDAEWTPRIGLVEVTISPGAALTVMRGAQ